MKHSFVVILIVKIVIVFVVHIVFTLCCADVSNAIRFSGEFTQNSSAELGKSGGEKVKSPIVPLEGFCQYWTAVDGPVHRSAKKATTQSIK
jgi:hypothetical protein